MDLHISPTLKTLARAHYLRHLAKPDEGGGEDDDDDKDDDTDGRVKCGIGRCKPDWLQVLNNPYILVLLMSAYAFTHGFVVNGVNNVNTSSYERRFSLSSNQAGWINAANDVSSSVLGILVGHLGARRYKARWVAGGTFITAVGCLCMGLPHFVTGRYSWGQDDVRICRERDVVSCDVAGDPDLQHFIFVLIAGYFLMGVSGSTLLTVGMSWIDDSIPQKSSPLYSGIVYSCLYLGVSSGFVAGGQALDLYVDFESVPEERWIVTPDDPRWVGAWWLGFFCAAAVLFLLTLVFLLYGEEMPSARVDRRERRIHQQVFTFDLSQERSAENGVEKKDAKKFLPTLQRLMRRPTFVFLCLGYSCTFLNITALAVFLPKIIQNQFSTTAAISAAMAGVTIIFGAGAGQLLGGVLVKKLKLEVRGCLAMTSLLMVVATPVLLGFLLYCDQAQIAGWNASYRHHNDSLQVGTVTEPVFDSGCNQGCGCRLDLYEPVCDSRGLQYFSPCYAGCTAVTTGTKPVYTNCTCAPATLEDRGVSTEACTGGCSLQYALLALILVSLLGQSALFIPVQTAIFRISGESDKTLGIGIMWFHARLLGAIPGPIILGAVIDVTCVVWGEACGARGSCWIYDNALLGRNVAFLCIAVNCAGTIFYGIAYKCFRPNKFLSSEDSENKCVMDAGTFKLSVSSSDSPGPQTGVPRASLLPPDGRTTDTVTGDSGEVTDTADTPSPLDDDVFAYDNGTFVDETCNGHVTQSTNL